MAHVSVLHSRLIVVAKGGYIRLQPLTHESSPRRGCPILCGPHVHPTYPTDCGRKGWVYNYRRLSTPTRHQIAVIKQTDFPQFQLNYAFQSCCIQFLPPRNLWKLCRSEEHTSELQS